MPTLLQLHGPAPTGRDAWADALVAIAAPATRLAALGPGRQPVHGSTNDPGATWFELVARPLWGLAAHAAGGLTGGETQWDQARTALAAAVDPDHAWYIGPPMDLEQRLVESAAVGYALAAAPQHLWDPLSAGQQERLADWLSAAALRRPHENNWRFFPVLAAAGLRAVGVPVDEAVADAHLDRIEDFALSDGWYADGDHGARDYYVPFGFHFYSLLLASLKAVDDDRAALYRRRAREFAAQFRHWFAADGAAVPFGRSLAYRFAQGSFWSALAAVDLPAVDWPVARGLAERNLAWWWRQPLAAEDGSLTPGYGYANAAVVEEYIGGGSPYWGTKVFAALAAPAGHPFWTCEPSGPAPAETVSVQSAAAMVLTRDAHGDVVALAGQRPPAFNPRGAAAKYAKFAYSSLAGFSVPVDTASLHQGAFDSTLALSDDGTHWRTRTDGETVLDGETLIVRWSPWPDVTVETRLTPDGGGHLREHRITTARPLHTAEGGFCVPLRARGRTPSGTVEEKGFASAAADGISSEIVCHGPDGGRRVGEAMTPMAGSHLVHPRTVLPMLRGTLKPGEHILRCRVSVTRG
jgi:hypothetical protein